MVWSGLRIGHLDDLAHSVLRMVLPHQHVEYLLDEKRKEKFERDKQILRGLGEFTLAAYMGQCEIDPDTLQPVWEVVKQSDGGAEFGDVFDPHTAALLEEITPKPREDNNT